MLHPTSRSGGAPDPARSSLTPAEMISGLRSALAVLVVIAVQFGLPRTSVAQLSGPIIAEFVAQNQSSLKDEDGDSSDWIEIWNPAATESNLKDWALTDDAGELGKWRFPDTPIAGGARVIVFASDKDKAQAGEELHTNFKLDAGGEYLALTRPDGAVASAWVKYPIQAPDVAYGVAEARTTISVVAIGSVARHQFPSDSEPDKNWTQLGYDDSAWPSGATPLGFDLHRSFATYADLVMSEDPMLYWNFDEPDGPALNRTNPGMIQDALSPQGEATRGENPLLGLGKALELDGSDASRFVVSRLSLGQDLRGPFAVEFWCRNASPLEPTYFIEGGTVDGTLNSPGLITGFTGPRLELFGGGGRTAAGGPLLQDTNWHHILFGYYGSGAGDGVASRQEVWVDGKRAVSRVNDFNGPLVFGGGSLAVGATMCCDGLHGLNGAIDELAVHDLRALKTEPAVAQKLSQMASNHWLTVSTGNFGMPFATDLTSTMSGSSSSVRLRQSFALTNDAYNRLTLRVRYNDGFAAWLNGVPVLLVNAPAGPLPGSTALTNRAASEALVPELFDLSSHLHLLREGTNVLAMEGFNVAKEDPDFLIGAELELGTAQWVSGYFSPPTPGTANGIPLEVPGPTISEVTNNPKQPFPEAGLAISARVVPVLQALTQVRLRYRVMHAPEQELAMSDDGVLPDRVAEDGVYSALIPPGSFSSGQMLRWSVRAIDARGTVSRAPAVVTGVDASEYFGTVAAGGSLASPVPVLEWFLQPGSEQAARSRVGARACVFFDGEFYDNVLVQLRGATAAGLAKNPYDFRFNPDHEFRYARGYPRLNRFALNTTWRDKAYVRQVLCFDFFRDVGVPASIAFPAHVRRNNEFFSLAMFVEIPGRDYLQRNGLDPDGALYKADLNGFTLAAQGGYRPAESGFEKKEPDDTDRTDILEFTRGLALRNEELTRFVFDNVDLPGQINYMAASVVLQDADRLVTNFYPYRDTQGTGEWRMLPWDMDLTLGQANNSIDEIQAASDSPNGASHPFYGSRSMADYRNPALWNRLIDVIVSIPVFREMYLRRLRTLMDEFLKPGATEGSDLYFEPRLQFWHEALSGLAEQDRMKWSYWGQSQTLARALELIEKTYLPARRTHLFTNHSVLRPTYRENAGIPLAQSAWPNLQFGQVQTQPPEVEAQEHFQVVNLGAEAWDLSRWRVTGAVEFTFRSGTVIPGGGVLNVASDVRAFRAHQARRGQPGNFVQGNFHGSLLVPGEKLEIRDPRNRVWAVTNTVPAPSAVQRFLRVTELMYHPAEVGAGEDPENAEFIELCNVGDEILDLRGVRFTQGVTFDFGSSAVTRLAPGERVLVVRNRSTMLGLGGELPIAGEYVGNLANSGERLALVDAAGGIIENFSYDDQWYPMSDGTGYALVVADESGPRSALNRRAGWRAGNLPGGSPAKPELNQPLGMMAGPVILSEIMYHPNAQQNLRNQSPVGETAELLASYGWDESTFEYVLLKNTSSNAVHLFEQEHPENTWKLQGAVEFSFPPGFTLEADGEAILVSFDPSTDNVALSAFHVVYPWSLEIPILGPWQGQLNNAGERLELIQLSTGNHGALLDAVDYQPVAPWPEEPDLYGLSLQRQNHTVLGTVATAWVASAPGSGRNGHGFLPPTINTAPADVTVEPLSSATFVVGVTGWPLPRIQWLFNGLMLPGRTNATMTVLSAHSSDAGEYSALVYNEAGAVVSTTAKLVVNSDSDNDLLPDNWMLQHFGHPLAYASDKSRAEDDCDQDGMTNLAEFIAGTMPRDEQSKLVLSASIFGEGIRLEFLAISNLTYTVQVTDDDPRLQNWRRLVDVSARSTTGVVHVSDTNLGTTNRFYRLATPRIP